MPTKKTLNYFQKPNHPIEQTLQSIKGNFRRMFVANEIANNGPDSIPPAWLTQDISETLKGFLQGQHPQARGGEDLPDLEEGEIEIARVTLANTVHREVSSLRAKNLKSGKLIGFQIVDEYGNDIELPFDEAKEAITGEEIIDLFLDSEPTQVGDENLEYSFQSIFYDDLNLIASKRGIEITELDW